MALNPSRAFSTHTPLRVLKAQTNNVARVLKEVDRGQKTNAKLVQTHKITLLKQQVKFVMFMDGHALDLVMPIEDIVVRGEVALSEYILKAMCHARGKLNVREAG
jgi:hypothetical protein